MSDQHSCIVQVTWRCAWAFWETMIAVVEMLPHLNVIKAIFERFRQMLRRQGFGNLRTNTSSPCRWLTRQLVDDNVNLPTIATTYCRRLRRFFDHLEVPHEVSALTWIFTCRCRVDFSQQPTSIQNVFLRVIGNRFDR